MVCLNICLGWVISLIFFLDVFELYEFLFFIGVSWILSCFDLFELDSVLFLFVRVGYCPVSICSSWILSCFDLFELDSFLFRFV